MEESDGPVTDLDPRQVVAPGVLELDLDAIDPIAGVICGARVWALHEGDALELRLPPECADALIMDPPAGIGFMGREWDKDKGGMEQWIAAAAKLFAVAFGALKPGAHGAVWALPRTSDWTMQALRRAGFEIREVVAHCFGSGFPKSLDINRAIDSMRADDPRPVCRFLRAAMDARGLSAAEIAGRFGFHSRMVDHWAARDTDSQPAVPTMEQWAALRGLLGFGPEMDVEVARLNERKGQRGDAWNDREVIGEHEGSAPGLGGERFKASRTITAPATPEARKWAGWGTALKPAHECWVIVRKPLRGTVAANVVAHGTGGINIDAARVFTDWSERSESWKRSGYSAKPEAEKIAAPPGNGIDCHPAGRWPSNLVLSHSSWDESECRACGVVAPFVVRFCPACGSGDVEAKRGGCRCVGERRVRGSHLDHECSGGVIINPGTAHKTGHTDEDGLETVDAWECLATCERCGVSALVPSGGDAGRCACGFGRRWACAVALLDEQSGCRTSGTSNGYEGGVSHSVAMGAKRSRIDPAVIYGDSGGASRFFHCFPPEPFEPPHLIYSAKPSTAEREAGLSGEAGHEPLPRRTAGELTGREDGSAGTQSPRAGAGRTSAGRANIHPTVKGFHLIGHFCDLLVPPGGLVLDLTAGSGTLGAVVAHRHAATRWRCIMAELDPEHCRIIRERCKYWGARPWRPRVRGKASAKAAKPAVVASAQPSLFDGGQR